MKKMISLLLAAAMILSLGVAVFAEDKELSQTTKNGDVEVSYTIADSAATGTYTVTIPANVAITDLTNGNELEISADKITLLVSKKLTIKLASQNSYVLKKDSSTSQIPYTCLVGTEKKAVPADGIILEVTGEGAMKTTSGSTKLNVSTTADNINSATETGKHYDILTFTCEVTDVSTSTNTNP